MPTTPTSRATPTGQTAIPLPPAYANLATAEHPEAGILKYLDDRYQKTGQPPTSDRFKIENGHVVETQPGWLLRNPWFWPVLGASLGLAGAALAVPAAAGTAGGATGATGAVGAGVTGGTAAGTTAAGAAGGAAATSTVAKYLTPALQYGLPIAGSLIGAGITSSGLERAAEIQAQSFKDALEYEKQRDEYLKGLESQRYGELNARLQPYIATGQTASDRMASLLGLNPSGHGYTPPQPAQVQNAGVLPTTQPGGAPIMRTPTLPDRRTMPAETPTTLQPPAPTPQMVTMRAPDGSTRNIPVNQVARFQSLGAEVVNG
jgi:hypothetical protein